jgi:hypothetical protein
MLNLKEDQIPTPNRDEFMVMGEKVFIWNPYLAKITLNMSYLQATPEKKADTLISVSKIVRYLMLEGHIANQGANVMVACQSEQ